MGNCGILTKTGEEVVDVLWSTTSAFLRDQCVGLRTVDLTFWAENGGLVEETLPCGDRINARRTGHGRRFG